ncbi:DUF4360 domain-containing protein [Phytohabitans aurantiacus]|jgi:hypothetical protein|uniref:DUF4360 domain-containing protein n=1 Tax=Phytohabitans aurantiacus TaxID=3016789 RepID=A0ABQ5QPI8_9ACTN|nr:DUF4360 domain-containing protein [Phytohabitans aurantiacus]GLH95872.1 hypothetical protein Pa4123_11440 [Phytohabitans aurantiacus]
MRRVMIAGAAVFALLAPALLVASPASAVGWLDDPVPPPNDRIVIDVVTVLGNGCPAGTAAVAVSPDNTAFTVTYSNYLAQVGVGSRPTDFRKNCQLNVAVHVPAGFTYAIAKADYRGFASLATGATATQSARYYFQGMSQTAFVNHPFRGPFEDNWFASDQTDIASLVYHPCGAMRNLNINTELRVSAGTSNTATTTSFLSMDSTDGSIQTVYHFNWQHCPRR